MVRLVSSSVPCIELQEGHLETAEDLVAYCARVSNPSNQLNHATSRKLLDYMIKHKHWSPFEMANVCVEINTTRDIARQILRHRSFSFQEFSQRYADPTFFDFGLKECRMEDLENRQNSLFCSDEETAKWWMEMQKEIWFSAVDIYKQARRRGIAKEVARSVLPEGLTPSRMFMNGTLRSWIHYLELRTGVETQAEHRVIAWECLYIIASVFPLIKERIVSGEENSSNSEKD